MSTLLGGCRELEQMTGMPTPANGCCTSCMYDASEYLMELYADMDDLGPNVPPDGWFKICCAHYNTYKDWRK